MDKNQELQQIVLSDEQLAKIATWKREFEEHIEKLQIYVANLERQRDHRKCILDINGSFFFFFHTCSIFEYKTSHFSFSQIENVVLQRGKSEEY